MNNELNMNYYSKKVIYNKNSNKENNKSRYNFKTIKKFLTPKNATKINKFSPLKKLDNRFILLNLRKKINKKKEIIKELVNNNFNNLNYYSKKIVNLILLEKIKNINLIIDNFKQKESIENSFFDFDIDCNEKDNTNKLELDLNKVYNDLKIDFNNKLLIELKLIIEKNKSLLIKNIMSKINIFTSNLLIIINLINTNDLKELKNNLQIEENIFDDWNKIKIDVCKNWIKEDYYFKLKFEKKIELHKKNANKPIKIDLKKEDKLKFYLENGKIFLIKKLRNIDIILKKLKTIKLLENKLNN